MTLIEIGEHFALASLRHLQGYDRRWVRTSVGRIHVCERDGGGSRPPLVLMHGLSSAGVHYANVVRHLDETARVILPDLPGHGFSDKPKRLDRDTLLNGMIESLDQLIDRPAILSGNSLGGYTAIRYALARPEKVAGLMLAAPAGAGIPEAELAELRSRFRLSSHAEALDFVDALFARRKKSRHFYALGLRAYFSLPQTLSVLEQFELANMFTPDEVRSLKMPILFLWGDSERLLPQSCLAFFQRNLPAHAWLECVPGWGHSGFLDDPKGFAHRLSQFVAEVSRAPRRGSSTADASTPTVPAPIESVARSSG